MERERAQGASVSDAGSAVRAFLGELIDDAGLFPPAKLSMYDALAAHERAEASPYYWMLGRFVVPASRLPELIRNLDDSPDALPVCAIVDGDPAADLPEIATVARDNAARIVVETLESKAPVDTLAAAYETAEFIEGPALYVEVTSFESASLDATLSAIARRRTADSGQTAAKVRCGGLTASVTAGPAELARFVAVARNHEVPFKATAGLHHPIRHFNAAAGFTMHGFLNVLGAAILAHTHPGFHERQIEKMIADEDPMNFALDAERFAWRDWAADANEIGEARARAIHSYGSCSFTEPVDDLIALGMLERLPEA